MTFEHDVYTLDDFLRANVDVHAEHVAVGRFTAGWGCTIDVVPSLCDRSVPNSASFLPLQDIQKRIHALNS